MHGHHEKPPYDDNTMRSAYHIRNVDVFRLKQLEGASPDIMMSHDWPRSVYNYGNVEQLLRYKKHFREEIEQDRLGSLPTKEVLATLQPPYWFSAHLHCKFAALVQHDGGTVTRFLALDKCLPRRQFLQVQKCKGKGRMVREKMAKAKRHKNTMAKAQCRGFSSPEKRPVTGNRTFFLAKKC